MRPFFTCTILSLCLLAGGCTLSTIDYDYDRDFDFSTLKQYRWLAIPEDFPGTEITVQRIKRAVDQQMTLKGFTLSEESPDFLISLQGFRDIVREGVSRGEAYRGYRGYDYGYRYGYGYERPIDIYEYEKGTLTVTFINAAGNNLIWQGSATITVDPGLSVESKDKRTHETVAKLLADFPPLTLEK